MLAATDLCFLICEMNIEIRSVRVFAEHGKALVADLKRLLGHVALHGVGGAGIAEDLPAVAAMVLVPGHDELFLAFFALVGVVLVLPSHLTLRLLNLCNLHLKRL